MSANQKFLAALLLFAVWVGLVIAGLAPTADLVAAIRDALIGLGVFHATQAQPPK